MTEIQRVYVKAWRDPDSGIVLDELNKDSEMIPTLVFPRPEDIVDGLAAAYPLIAAQERAKAARDVADRIETHPGYAIFANRPNNEQQHDDPLMDRSAAVRIARAYADEQEAGDD